MILAEFKRCMVSHVTRFSSLRTTCNLAAKSSIETRFTYERLLVDVAICTQGRDKKLDIPLNILVDQCFLTRVPRSPRPWRS